MSDTESAEGVEVSEEEFADVLGGDIEPKEEPEQPEEQSTETEESAEEPAEEQEETEETDEEDETESEDEDAEEEEEAAEALQDYDKEQKIVIDKDGEKMEISLGDLIKGHHRGDNYENKVARVREKEESLEGEISEYAATREQYMQVMQQVVQKLSNDEIMNVDMDVLAEEDQAEYIRVKHKQEQKQRDMGVVQAEVDKVQTAIQEDMENRYQGYKDAENVKFLDALPEYKDSAVSEKLNTYLKSNGFDEASIETLTDSRVKVMFDKAMRFDKAQANVSKKTPRKPPKMLRSGTSKPANQRKSDSLVSAQSRLKQSGSDDDFMAVLDNL